MHTNQRILTVIRTRIESGNGLPDLLHAISELRLVLVIIVLLLGGSTRAAALEQTTTQ